MAAASTFSSPRNSAISIRTAAITGVNAFADGVTGGNVDGEPFDTRVDLHGGIRHRQRLCDRHAFAGKAWNFTLSGRYNRTTIDNSDRHQPAAARARSTGHNVFDRFNPAVGVTYSPHALPERVFQLQRRQPRADVDRAGLRRSESALQAAERAGRRSAA